MRVNIICGDDPCKDKIAQTMCSLLTDYLSREEDVLLAEDNPDILHFVGAWSASTTALAKRAIKCRVPFVYTPLGSLSPWHKPTMSQLKLSAAAQTIVASGVMEQTLLSKQGMEHVVLIPNCVTTNTTTLSAMASAYSATYERDVNGGERSVWTEIDDKVRLLNESDENIVSLCRSLLYAQYLYDKRCIPKDFLLSLTNRLKNSDYDEEHFADVLHLISLYDFTQRLEYVLQEQAALTEGFMPIPMNSDKKAKEMLKAVTDYES